MKHLSRVGTPTVSCGIIDENIPLTYKTVDPYAVTCPKCLVNMINTLTKVHCDVVGLSNP
jgi:hypothetical protein